MWEHCNCIQPSQWLNRSLVCVRVRSVPSDVIMKRTQPFPAAPSNNQDSIGHHLCGRHAKRKDNIVPDLETITLFHKEQHGYTAVGQGRKSITTVLKWTSSYLHPALIAIISLKNQTQIGIMIFKDLPWVPAFYKLFCLFRKRWALYNGCIL